MSKNRKREGCCPHCRQRDPCHGPKFGRLSPSSAWASRPGDRIAAPRWLALLPECGSLGRWVPMVSLRSTTGYRLASPGMSWRASPSTGYAYGTSHDRRFGCWRLTQGVARRLALPWAVMSRPFRAGRLVEQNPYNVDKFGAETIHNVEIERIALSIG